MEDVVEILKENLDYENNYYFYHATGSNIGQNICEEGLLLTGHNILDVDNLLFTTAAPLSTEITDNPENFADFLFGEAKTIGFRKVTDLVILGIPKDELDTVIQPYNNEIDDSCDVDGYKLPANYIIDPAYVLGYVDLINEELILNENYFDYVGEYGY